MNLRTLIIDDEELARKRLKSLLSGYKEIVFVGEATNGKEAVEKIDSIKPDLVFLDIKMPGFNGFEVIEKINHLPAVVFCTAYDDFALQAFETSSIDYLVKPVEKERLDITLDKIHSLNVFPDKALLIETIKDILNSKNLRETTVLPIKGKGKVIFVKLQDVSFIMASEKFLEVFTRNGKKHLMEQSLKYIENKLPAYFLRIHRSIILNANEIREVQKYFSGKYVFIMNDISRTKLISSRNYGKKIREILEI